jgi:hypothetical protein
MILSITKLSISRLFVLFIIENEKNGLCSMV